MSPWHSWSPKTPVERKIAWGSMKSNATTVGMHPGCIFVAKILRPRKVGIFLYGLDGAAMQTDPATWIPSLQSATQVHISKHSPRSECGQGVHAWTSEPATQNTLSDYYQCYTGLCTSMLRSLQQRKKASIMSKASPANQLYSRSMFE